VGLLDARLRVCYRAEGRGRSSRAELLALADLDCDGEPSRWARQLRIDPATGEVAADPTEEEIEPLRPVDGADRRGRLAQLLLLTSLLGLGVGLLGARLARRTPSS